MKCRPKALEFLSRYVRPLGDGSEPMGGVLRSSWVETLDLPGDLAGGSPLGTLGKYSLAEGIKPILKRQGYKRDKGCDFS